MDVTRKDLDAAGWGWLDRMVSSMCDEEPSDIAYSADQMVDAFIAGATAQSEAAELRKEVGRLRTFALKAFTIVEWATGEGYVLTAPHCDCDDTYLEGVALLGVETADDARAALKETQHEG